MRLQWGSTTSAIKIWRDGQLRDWTSPDQNATYRTLDGEHLIDQPWQGDGTLTVAAGGKQFRSAVNKAGKVTFAE
jgi:hypothetical protein